MASRFDLDGEIAVERRAALFLFGLDEADRAWLLNRLDDGARQRAKSLLGELGELNFDKRVLRSRWPVLKAAVFRRQERKAPTDVIAQLDAFSAEDIVTLLEGESREVLDALLSSYDWTWRQAVASRMNVSMKVRANSAQPNTKIPRAVETALLEAALARISGRTETTKSTN